ncbi:cupin [Phyllobacterium zundukense]|uniref:Cupin n=1 Tax=Phyllobacterium zundukense TaxID=1867719 RepID=A0A2N9VV91_9HYPH|nr:cupin [Phyllobacterium zundukense]
MQNSCFRVILQPCEKGRLKVEPVERKPIILGLKQGRGYDCGTMSAVFKADGIESGDRYSVSEWWLEPNSKGPGAHSHDENDELFLVIEGQPSILVGETWYESPAGSFLMIPAKTIHDFENRSAAPAGLFNVFIPGGFEKNMPSIVEWFQRGAVAR